MKYLFLHLVAFSLMLMAGSAALAQPQAPILLENPTVSSTQIAFSFANDIWIVDRNGGKARQLTTNPARDVYPVFSPDGSEVAFARFNPGSGPLGWDVYVISVASGEERRVTYHPDLDFPVNWTPDGKRILIQSFRHRTSIIGGRLYTVPSQGGFAIEVPVPRGWDGSFSPNGDRIAYTPLVNTRDIFSWRNYRGGGAGPVWLVKLADGSTEVIPHANFNDTDPMWIGDKIYFVSDRAGTENLFVYDTTKKSITQLTKFEKYGIKSASNNGEAIVFNQGGAVYLFDSRTNEARQVSIEMSGDFPELRPRKIDPVQWMSSVSLSPDAGRMLMGIRGEVFMVNTTSGSSTNMTVTPDSVERNPVWSPDGKWIAFFRDVSGEVVLILIPVPGGGGVRQIIIDKKSSQYNELTWSPDSSKLVFSDSHLRLRYFDLADSKVHLVDTAKHTDGDFSFQPAWSPDSRWLAYSKFGFNRLRSITLFSLDTGKTTTVTTTHYDAQQPLFDNNGRYLYFIGGNRTGLVESQGMSGFPFRTQVSRSLFSIVLNRNDSSPLIQTANAPAPNRVQIDLDRIVERILLMPFWPPNAGSILAGKPGTLFIVEAGNLHKFVAGKAGLEKFIEGAGNFRITSDGSRLAYRRQGVWAVVSTDAPPKPEDGRFKLSPIELTIDPRAEGKQMFGEAWRQMRENFYDPNLHGQNLEEVRAHYED